MQTFLSEPTFAESAAVLDNARLNKQLLEGRQMLNALAGNQKGFLNHPATNMWRGYETTFVSYLRIVAMECARRDISAQNNWDAIAAIYMDNFEDSYTEPPWWKPSREKNRIMLSHRANLYNKDPEHYAQYLSSAGFFAKMLADEPTSVVCCAARRRITGVKGLQPCQYYWPTHKE